MRTCIALVVTLGLSCSAAPRSAAETVLVGRGAYAAQSGTATPVPGLALSLRGGVMTTPRGAAVVGADFDIPGLRLFDTWSARLDADMVLKANLAGVNTLVVVTLDQIHYTPDAAGRSLYFGGGIGAVLGDATKLDLKAILGTELTSRLAVEGNLHFNDSDTMMLVVGRLHL